jgi:AhpD family alkylhydroperoxidase
MPEHYHDDNDLKLMREMRKLASDDFNAWLGLNSIVERENGAIPRKYRELMAIGIACTTQCPYCMEAHAKAAHAVGATRGGRRSIPHRGGIARRRKSDAWRDGAEILRSTGKRSKG